MHIVLDGRFFRRTNGGISRYTHALIRELARIDQTHRYTVLLRTEDQDEWDDFATEQDLTTAQWQTAYTDIAHYSYAEQTQLPRVLARLAPDRVHFTNFNHPITWNRPFVITIHDLTIFNYPVGRRQESALAQLAFRTTIRHAIRRAQTVITVSETSKNDLVQKFGAQPDRVAVTYEGVDPHYQPINLPQRGRQQRYLKDQYGMRSPYLLFVSQWRPHKGIIRLLEAYEAFRDRFPRLKPQLVIVGQPHPSYPAIPARIDSSSYRTDIVRPGFVSDDDLPKLYQSAEAFVFPSEYEGFGLTPLEAMACGVPVIASNSSCFPEILGEAALLVDPQNRGGWVAAIEQLLTDRSLWRDLRSRGLAHARRYSWRTMAEATLALYQAAVHRS